MPKRESAWKGLHTSIRRQVITLKIKTLKSSLIAMAIATCMMTSVVPVQAASLDDIVAENTEQQSEVQIINETHTETVNEIQEQTDIDNTEEYITADQFINSMKDVTDVTTVESEAVHKINGAISKTVGVVIQILSYMAIALLSVRVVLDILFIAIPFSRSLFVSTDAGQGGPSAGMGGNPFDGGMGSMNSMNQQAPASQSQSKGSIQWISGAAMNAVDMNETVAGSFKYYIKDMVVVLTLTPVLIILAVTGVLTNLGFLLGDVAVNFVAWLGTLL